MKQHFSPGSTTFTCTACGRRTRDTGVQSVGSTLCPQDYELAGIYNELQDHGEEALTPLADDIRAMCNEIVAAGGTLDSDAQELLAVIDKQAESAAEQQPVGVLAELDRRIELEAMFGDASGAIVLRKVRAAVAELVEAGQELVAAQADYDRLDAPGGAKWDRLSLARERHAAALARVGGEA